MALFAKRPITDSAPSYSIGANKTMLVIGLGNPGKQYAGSRHNIGFAVLDNFAKDNGFPGWIAKGDLKCQLSIHTLGETRVILAKPQTFMNHSGQAVSAVARFYRVYNPDTLAVYDELALQFGQIRARLGGSDAGHNGVKSLIAHLGDDFGRLRIGIGSEIANKTDDAGFVLGKFSRAEKEHLPKIVSEASAMLTEYVFSGQLPHDTRSVP